MSRLSTAACVTAALLTIASVGIAPGRALSYDSVSDGQWFHSYLRTDEAHKITTGEGVTVAVIDSGVDASHPDLSGSILTGADFSSQGPGDGRTDLVGHGTAMAGLISAHGRVRGIAPGAKVVSVRTFTLESGLLSDKAIKWAVDNRVDVISISIGGRSDDPVIRRAIEEALNNDIVVVASTGNKPDTQSVGYPAAIPGVIAVSGIDKEGLPSKVSVSGSPVVIAAPSDGITSTALDGKWSVGTGTSDATAIVSGAVALVRAKFPDLSAAEVVHRLTATAVDKGPAGRDPQYGYGVLDIVAALTADVPPLASASPSTPAEPDSNNPWPLVIIIGAAVVAGLLVLLLVVRSRRRG